MLISNGPTIQLFESANYFNRRSNLSSCDLKFTSEYLYYRNLKQRYQREGLVSSNIYKSKVGDRNVKKTSWLKDH